MVQQLDVRHIVQLLILFAIGGVGYNIIEILWRGFSHPSMTLIGGICFVLIGLINETSFEYKDSIWVQALVGSFLITVMELGCGVVVNLMLNMNVWDYSDLPFNFMGQIAVMPSFGWFLLSVAIIFIDDFLKFVLFRDPIKEYNLKLF